MNNKRFRAITAAVIVAVLLLASSCTTLTNRQPIIRSLEAEAPGWTAPSGSLWVTCNASDPDGDVLNYNWSADGGSISGTGSEVIWTAPAEAGMYDITVVVDDGRGGSPTRTMGLTSSNGPPPVIEGLNVTAKEPKYLKVTTTGYKVGQTKEYYVECIASGNGTLSYNWTWTGGNVSGGGSSITWTAPNATCYVTVTAKAFDGIGNWVKKSIFFEVVDCSPCTFG